MKTAVAMAILLMGAGAQAAGDWETLGRQVTAELAARAFAKVEARFDATMKGALPVEKLGAVWDQVLAQAGPFQSVKQASVSAKGGYHVVMVTCAFAKGELDVKLAFDSAEKVSGLFFLPSVGGEGKWEPPSYGRGTFEELPLGAFGGKLTLPAGAGPFSAVVLVHGSGSHDEDETIGPNKPFRDLALGLAALGIATVRYPKRTLREPGAFTVAKKFTVKEEAIDDARAAVALLARQPKIDPKRIWVVGHSLGGFLAPRIADGNPQVAGIVILAGSTRPLEELVLEQMKFLFPKDPGKWAAAEASAKAIRDPKLTDAATVDLLGAKLPGSYFLDLRRYHPAEVAGKLKVPVLVLQGERDYQVRRADYDGWAGALQAHPNAKLKLYPALNHLFEAGTGEPNPDEYGRPGLHVSEEVVKDIAAFVVR